VNYEFYVTVVIKCNIQSKTLISNPKLCQESLEHVTVYCDVRLRGKTFQFLLWLVGGGGGAYTL
jgi:hypothetical protein